MDIISWKLMPAQFFTMGCIVYAPKVHGGTAEPDGLDRIAIVSLGEKGCLPCIQCSRNGALMVPVLNHEISEGANDPAQVNLYSGSKSHCKNIEHCRALHQTIVAESHFHGAG